MVGDCHATTRPLESQSVVNLLLVEDNLAEARLLQELLKGSLFSRFQLTHVKRLSEAIAQLQSGCFNGILLDLTLPDSTGLASLEALVQQAPNLPIVVLTNTNDNELAVEAVRRGAQDYLFKRQMNQDSLVRSLRYAIERKQSAQALQAANEILELRVQERTAELKAANEQLQREVTQRQQIQERLVLAQQAAKIGTFEWHIRSNAITWSAELEELYGLTAQHYDDWLAALHPDDRATVESAIWQAVSRGHGLDIEFRISSVPNETRWITVKSSLLRDASGLPQRLIGIHMDITEKKQLEAQFLRAQRLESLGTLAGGIAHDLNNILTPILGVVKLLPLKITNLDEQSQDLLKTLDNSAQRGADLVKQILSFARGVEGKRGYLQLKHLLLEVKRIIQQTVPKSIQVCLDVPTHLWAVSGDATQLHQVFVNLCVNARDAMPTGGELLIRAENHLIDQAASRRYLEAKPGAYVVVSVSDTGTGMSEAVIQRIFDPFFTTKAIGQGTGLGLSAVLGIVKSHGGFLDVQSQVDQGSQFQIFLPASQAAIAPPVAPGAELPVGQQQLVLVVDDELAICEITKATLETYHYQVLTASDGMEAITLFADHKDKIAVVLMDLMMPVMDGLAAITIMNRLKPDVCAIAMSGLTSKEAVARAKALGFQQFLAKPFTTEDLLQMLHQRLNSV
ncbi:ATP-binding response regulator [Almyronema epifaneia]|uniref:histidine kinase n=1 Tax=Almyronema epifaneia S1 TaxID=2991925 RepID=A0ABW6IIB1_9CYAN